MTYAEEIRLCVDCTNFVPNTSTKEVVLIQPQTQSQGKEGTPRHPMTESLFGLLRANLNMKSRSKLTLPQVRLHLLVADPPLHHALPTFENEKKDKKGRPMLMP